MTLPRRGHAIGPKSDARIKFLIKSCIYHLSKLAEFCYWHILSQLTDCLNVCVWVLRGSMTLNIRVWWSLNVDKPNGNDIHYPNHPYLFLHYGDMRSLKGVLFHRPVSTVVLYFWFRFIQLSLGSFIKINICSFQNVFCKVYNLLHIRTHTRHIKNWLKFCK